MCMWVMRMIEIRYWNNNSSKVVMEGNKKVLYIPEKKFKSLFPLAYRRKLEVNIVYDDGVFVIVSTYLPEQRQPRLRKLPRCLVFGDVRDLTRVIPPWQ